jgi:carbamoyl-phosphate synthase large subunit
LANYLQLNFCFGFQFKLDSEGVPKILESNPRVQGTMVASTLAGFNMIYYAVQSALGNDCVQSIEIKDKSCFKRLWGGIATTIEGDEIGRI